MFNLDVMHIRVPQSAEKSLVLVMAADPEPGDRIALKDADGAIFQRHSHSPDVFLVVNAFEMQ